MSLLKASTSSSFHSCLKTVVCFAHSSVQALRWSCYVLEALRLANVHSPLAAEFFLLSSTEHGDNFLHTYAWNRILFPYLQLTAWHGVIFWYSHFANAALDICDLHNIKVELEQFCKTPSCKELDSLQYGAISKRMCRTLNCRQKSSGFFSNFIYGYC